MSLVGNLADLGLGEILQIVSLSRRSGLLTLESRGRQGIVVFRFGQVIRATSSNIKYFLGEELLKREVIDDACLQKALQAQQAGAYKERLGTILIQKFQVPTQKIEDVVREQIEKVVYSFFMWEEGRFEFDVQDDVETIDDSKMDPLQFMLEQGLNPQYLAMEGSRIVDEKRHMGTPLEEEVDEPLLEEVPALSESFPEPDLSLSRESEEQARGKIIVVDDDQELLDFIVNILTISGNEVFAFASSEDALIKIDTLYRDGERPSVLLDLIMPRMDGSGVLGGLELLELLYANFEELPLIVMSDYRNSDAERRIRETGYEFLAKPRRNELSDPLIARVFSARLIDALQGNIPGAVGNDESTDVNIGDELRLELGEIGDQPSSTVVPSTGISMLRAMLEELHDPSLGGGVILLVLRFATEFVNRAVMFLVKDKAVIGAGQFGVNSKTLTGDANIQSFRISLEEESLFSEVLASKMTVKGRPAPFSWNEYLFTKLGGEPAEIFLGPILSEGKVVAILYGDNLPESTPIGDTDSLEIFLSQAGIAMEKALLEKRLKKREMEGV